VNERRRTAHGEFVVEPHITLQQPFNTQQGSSAMVYHRGINNGWVPPQPVEPSLNERSSGERHDAGNQL